MELYLILFLISLLLFLKPFLLPSRPKNLPPGPAGLPLLGSLIQLGARPHESLFNMARRYGPVMTLHLGSVTNIVISSPEAAQETLQKHDENFSDRAVPDVITAQPNPEFTLAWVPGDQQWRARRRVCSTQMFTARRLDALQHLRHQKVHQLIDHIKNCCALGKEVDIGQLAFATTLNLMSSTMFSIDIVDPEFQTAQEFKDLVWRIMEDAGKPNLSDYFPVIRRFDLLGLKRHIRPSYVRLHEIFDGIIDKRLEERAAGSSTSSKRGDFLDVLLDQCEEEGSDFNRQSIKPMILDLFIAGSDTYALTTEWAMAELLHNPSLLQNSRNELVTVIGTKWPIQELDTHHLPYLQAIVVETLHLHPAAPLLLPYRFKKQCGSVRLRHPKGHASPGECVGHRARPKLLGGPDVV
ncbi:geraniol 8-hydroxylase-like isoform X2 [Rhodamnia argentea]|uniref:Geraniol 8-hydroxylase-like isoform X2 n=1 Tax=Rhodamnia argentea TaxID=178133 RepID=A0ABM3H7P0_9MYRT|nr:geraniol 8-hydroxylase-like isoform X2 [Rhodamnia argentea]